MKKQGIGVGVIILNSDNEVLLLLRNEDAVLADSDMHLEGTYTLPSGKVNINETAIRKVKEETNLDILDGDLKIISIEDDINRYAHYVTVGFVAKNYAGTFKLKDSGEFVNYGWFSINNLPDNLCNPSKKIIKHYLSKEIYD